MNKVNYTKLIHFRLFGKNIFQIREDYGETSRVDVEDEYIQVEIKQDYFDQEFKDVE